KIRLKDAAIAFALSHAMPFWLPLALTVKRVDVYVNLLLLKLTGCIRNGGGKNPREREMNLQDVADALTKRVDGKSGLGGTLKFDLGSDGCLFIDGTGSANTVTVNRQDPASCTITMTAADFDELIHGRLQPTAAFMQGKMKVDGDMGLAMKLGQMV